MKIPVTIGESEITFDMDDVRGRIEISGHRTNFADKIAVESARLPGR